MILGPAVSAALLGLSAKIMTRMDINFTQAWLASLAVFAINMLVTFLSVFLLRSRIVGPDSVIPWILSFIACFPISSAICGFLISDPDPEEPIGFAKGALFTLGIVLIWLVVVLLCRALSFLPFN